MDFQGKKCFMRLRQQIFDKRKKVSSFSKISNKGNLQLQNKRIVLLLVQNRSEIFTFLKQREKLFSWSEPWKMKWRRRRRWSNRWIRAKFDLNRRRRRNRFFLLLCFVRREMKFTSRNIPSSHHQPHNIIRGKSGEQKIEFYDDIDFRSLKSPPSLGATNGKNKKIFLLYLFKKIGGKKLSLKSNLFSYH